MAKKYWFAVVILVLLSIFYVHAYDSSSIIDSSIEHHSEQLHLNEDRQAKLIADQRESDDGTEIFGYIIKFKEEPLLVTKSKLENEVELKEQEADKIQSMGLLSLYNVKLQEINELKQDIPQKLENKKKNMIAQHKNAKIEIRMKIQAGIMATGTPKLIGEYFNAFNGIAMDISEEEAEEIKKSEYVEDVYPNIQMQAMLTDSVPLIGVDHVWEIDANGNQCDDTDAEVENDCLTGKGVTIAVIDTGIDYTHPDLGACTTEEFLGGQCNKVIEGFDFVNSRDMNWDGDYDDPEDLPDIDPIDDNGHGTHCAGIAAGNGLLKGVAPDAQLVSYKVLDKEGYGYPSDIIAAIDKAVEFNQDSKGIDIISMSLGVYCDGRFSKYCGPDDPTSQAVDNTVNAGIVFVVAAGNQGSLGDYTIGSPGTARKAITVGASFNDNQVAKSSNLILNGQEIMDIESKFVYFSDFNRDYGSFEDEIVFIDDTYDIDEEVFGSIVMFEVHLWDFQERVQNVAALAPTVAIIYINDPWAYVDIPPQLTLLAPVNFPVIAVSKNNAFRLKNFIEMGATVSITIEKADGLPYFSSKGPVTTKKSTIIKPDVLAPGFGICATQLDGFVDERQCADNHVIIEGTSMATPHVAGAAALLKQKNPALNPEQIKAIIIQTSKDAALARNHQGSGIINPLDMVAADLAVTPSTLDMSFVGRTILKKTITLYNLGNENINVQLSVVNDNSDIAIQLSRNTISLEPGSSTIDVTIQKISNSAFDLLQRTDKIKIQYDNQEITVPISFLTDFSFMNFEAGNQIELDLPYTYYSDSGDIDGDGKVDIVLSRNVVALLRNKGNLRFEPKILFGPPEVKDGEYAYSDGDIPVEVADYDNDGALDILIGGVQGYVRVLYNRLNEEPFSQQIRVQNGETVEFNDFMFTITAIESSPFPIGSSVEVEIVHNDYPEQVRNFQLPMGFFADPTMSDYFENVKVTLLSIAEDRSTAEFLFEETGFELQYLAELGQTVYCLTSQDFDNDGDIDAMSCYSRAGEVERAIRYFENTGGSFIDRGNVFQSYSGDRISGLDSADYDNDGDFDLVMTYSETIPGNDYYKDFGYIQLLENTGSSFIESEVIARNGELTQGKVLTKARYNPRLVLEDFDKDGDIDIAVGDNSGWVELFQNVNGEYGRSIVSNFGDFTWGISKVDIDGDSDVDLLVNGRYLVMNRLFDCESGDLDCDGEVTAEELLIFSGWWLDDNVAVAEQFSAVENWASVAYFRFDYPPHPETFVFKLTDPEKIQEARDILDGIQTDAIHVTGTIIKDPTDYNPPWNYHLDPSSISFFEMAVEVCDANIQYVEDNLVDVGRSFLPGNQWCPWGSRPIEEISLD